MPRSDNHLAVLAKAMRADLPSLSDQAIESVRSLFIVRRFQSKSTINRENDETRLMFVVTEGWVREFYSSNSGQCSNVGFSLPGNRCGLQRPSTSLVAGAPTTMLSTTYSRFAALAASNEELKTYERRVLKRLLCESQNRERKLLSLDAGSRYAALLQEQPRVAGLVPKRELASYLGVTPVHLSRLRRRQRTQPVDALGRLLLPAVS